MNLWLKATPPWNNNITLINVIPTGGYAISIVASLIYSWVSDATGWRWQIMAFGGIMPLIGNIIVRTPYQRRYKSQTVAIDMARTKFSQIPRLLPQLHCYAYRRYHVGLGERASFRQRGSASHHYRFPKRKSYSPLGPCGNND